MEIGRDIAGLRNQQDRPARNDAQDRPKEGQNGERIGERTNLAWKDQKDGFYYVVVDALLKRGFNEDEIGKIGSGNFCRIFDTATAGHS